MAKDEPKDPPKPSTEDQQMDRFERMMATFVDMAKANQMTPEMLKAILEPVMSAAGKQNSEIMFGMVHPENKRHPQISAFSYPEGNIQRPKPTLTRRVLLNFHEEKEDQLTPAEIEAYNSINDDCEARNGLYKAEIRMRGRKREELHIMLPVASLDHRMNIPPSLLLVIHELKTGRSLADMNVLLFELAEAQAELARLRGAAPPVAKHVATPSSPSMPMSAGRSVADLERTLEATPTSALAR